MVLPYRHTTWVGDEDLNGLKENYIFETMGILIRGEVLLRNGVLENYDDDLFQSALIEMLIITRSLLNKYIHLNKQDKEIVSVLDNIKYFRDGLCHTDSWRSSDGNVQYSIFSIPMNYDGSIPWISKDSKLDKEGIGKADDIALKIGSRKLWIKKDLIEAFTFTRDYFSKKMPADYLFSMQCIKK